MQAHPAATQLFGMRRQPRNHRRSVITNELKPPMPHARGIVRPALTAHKAYQPGPGDRGAHGPRSPVLAKPGAGATLGRMSASDSFTCTTEHHVPGLELTLRSYSHPSGARHLHLDCEDAHRAFAVAFRTAPEDDTGLPHILEHLSLCGSRRYPVRDPFFMMLRRSLQTFMNAFTYPDMTCYPFATQVPKDFDNLLSIYLDAVFAPRLDPLDFAQEGWRLEPTDARADAPEAWALRGVVFNEMKGSMGNTDARLFDALGRELLDATCYRFNSGGDPEAIPTLAHADLVDYHRRHYGAANACFTTYGAVDLPAFHQRLAPYLAEHPGTPVGAPALQSPAGEARRREVSVPRDPAQDPRDVTCAVLNWLWGDTARIDAALDAELLDRLLTGHAGAPLTLGLDSSGLGRSSSGTGYMDFLRNGIYCAELKGMDEKDYDRFEPLVFEILESVARNGFASSEVDAAMHQVELARRSIGGDSLPFGLQLCLRCIKAWNHDADPVESLDQDAAIARARDRVADPAYLTDLLRGSLLDNQSRLLLLARADDDFNARMEQRLDALRDERLAQTDTAERAHLRENARALLARQEAEEDPSVLPDLGLDDVPAERPWAAAEMHDEVAVFQQRTNGILHSLALLQLPPLTTDELRVLPTLSACIGRLGVGKNDYRSWSATLNATCADLGASHSFSCGPADTRVRGTLSLEVEGLADRRDDFLGHLPRALAEQRFDEEPRFRELISQALNGMQHRVLASGHTLAASAACRHFGGRSQLGHELYGLGRIPWLRSLLEDPQTAAEVRAAAEVLLARLRELPLRTTLIGDAALDAVSACNRCWAGWPRAAGAASAIPLQELAPGQAPRPTAFTTATPVNYCALGFRAPPFGDPDAAALAVASQYLRNNVLHPRIREQGGAYGAAARFDPSTCTFIMATYRDPRLGESFADMEHAARWLCDCPADDDLLREAILGVIAGIDAPASPAGEARRRFIGDQLGFGPETHNAFRDAVLAVRTDDLHRVASTHLDPAAAGRAVITAPDRARSACPDWEQVAL